VICRCEAYYYYYFILFYYAKNISLADDNQIHDTIIIANSVVDVMFK